MNVFCEHTKEQIKHTNKQTYQHNCLFVRQFIEKLNFCSFDRPFTEKLLFCSFEANKKVYERMNERSRTGLPVPLALCK